MMLKSFEMALKKGVVGEAICRQHLERKGWVVYQPITDGAHAFDMLAIKDKRKAVAIDIKSKARMNRWRATGINQRHFEVYRNFSDKHKMPFWLFFVDECERSIYGNSLSALEQPKIIDGQIYPVVKKWRDEIRIWHLDQMIVIGQIDEEMACDLEKLSQRSYQYAPAT